MAQAKKNWSVEVFVNLKPSVLDPQGATIQRALNGMGYAQLKKARLGKYFQLEFDSRLARSEVEKQVKHMCDKLLANPVIEFYRFQVAGGEKMGKR